MFRVRAISFLAGLSFTVTLAPAALAQASLDDVHVTPREKTVNVATTAYGAAPATGVAAGSLIRAKADLVLVPVSITDDRYRPIIGLDQENFQLFENKKPQEIKHFSSEDAPVSVGFLVDTSGSMADKVERAREAVQQFCEEANPQDEFFLITFSNKPELATDFTSRPEEIENDLLTARSKGYTSLLDAIFLGLDKMRTAHYARKALLILSDGGDNHSRYSERDVRAAIKESDVTVYAVGTFDRWVATEEERLGPELLASIADLSGGHSFTLTNFSEVPSVTRAIGRQLRFQYMLAYQPDAAPNDGKWRKIKVKLRLPHQLRSLLFHAESRPGYFASEQ